LCGIPSSKHLSVSITDFNVKDKKSHPTEESQFCEHADMVLTVDHGGASSQPVSDECRQRRQVEDRYHGERNKDSNNCGKY